MKTETDITENTAIERIKQILPKSVLSSLEKSENLSENLSEIRLRASGACSLTAAGENFYLCTDGAKKEPRTLISVTKSDLDMFLRDFCFGSVYAYENTIKEGYVGIGGIRVGICGNATEKDGKMSGFSDISSVNIRIPHHVFGCSDGLFSKIPKEEIGYRGVLIVSPPGVGKTTALRDIAIKLSRKSAFHEPFRVVIIDERDEIFIEKFFYGCLADALSGVKKETALECAVRVMSPQIVICDEIGSKEEAKIISDANVSGVTFFASVHGKDENSVFSKPWLKKLFDDGVFSYVYVLQRNENGVFGILKKYSGSNDQND